MDAGKGSAEWEWVYQNVSVRMRNVFLGKDMENCLLPSTQLLLGLFLWELSAFFFKHMGYLPSSLFWVETNLCFGRELFLINSLNREKINSTPCSRNCTSQNFTFPSPDSKVVPGRMSCGPERGCALLPHLLWQLPGLAVWMHESRIKL